MKTLSPYIKYYKKQCVLSPLFKLAESVMELLVPIVIASLIDNAIATGDKLAVWSRGGLLLLFAVCGFVFAVCAQYFAAGAAVGTAARMRRDLFVHIGGLSYSTLDELGSSTLVTRMTADVNQVQTGVNLTLRLLLRSPFIVFGALIAAFLIDVKTAIVFSVTIPLLALAVFLVTYFTIPLYKKVQAKLDLVLNAVHNNLTGARVIRAFGIQETEKNEFEKINGELRAEQNKVGSIAAVLNPITYLIINLAIALIIKIGGNRIYQGDLSQGNLVALYSYMTQILIELVKLANLIVNLSKTAASVKRIKYVLDLPVEERCGQADGVELAVGKLEYRGVNMRFDKAQGDALTGIDFSIDQGQTLGVIGGTGSGKTTLINLLPLFYKPSTGSINVFGCDSREMDTEKLRSVIAVVPQKAVLFKGTIRQNLLWGDHNASDEDLWEALEYSQSKDFVMEKEGGLDYELTQNGDNLSGGQKQRLTIARALVRKPKILILDDSSSALDYATEAALRKSLAALPYKPTMIISSQRTTSVMHADKIVVLKDGVQVGVGSHDELLRECQTYREIYDSQFKKAE